MEFEDFRQDPKTVAAVERKLQLISEAAIRLGEDAERLCPGMQGGIFAASGIGSAISMIGSISKRSGVP